MDVEQQVKLGEAKTLEYGNYVNSEKYHLRIKRKKVHLGEVTTLQ